MPAKRVTRGAKSPKTRPTPYSIRSQVGGQSQTPGPSALNVPPSEEQTSSTTTNEDNSPDFLCNKLWRVFNVSPLINFSYNYNELRQYESIISAFIEREKKKNMAVIVDDHESDYNVKISIISSLRKLASDPNAIKITVTARNTVPSKKGKLLFIGVFLSCGRSVESWEEDLVEQEAIHLPIWLTYGKLFFLKSVGSFFMTNFSCNIRQNGYSRINLEWLMALWINHGSGNDRPLELVYYNNMKELHTIEYSIDAATAKEVWERVNASESDTVSNKDVKIFSQMVERHFLVMFSLKLATMNLGSVTTGIASIKRKGVLKIFDRNAIKFVLRCLTQISQRPFL